MKKEKFKISWRTKSVDEINIKEQIFFVLSDRRYLNLLSNNAKNLVLSSMSFDQYKTYLKKNKMYNPTELATLRVKKKQELEDKTTSNTTVKEKASLNKALKLLNTCYTINKNVKQKAYDYKECEHCDGDGCGCCDYRRGHTSVKYNLRDYEYSQKTKLIIKVINLIKDNLLPIKYGKNDGIVYFEYLGNQVSFHDPKNQITNCKKFDGVWTGTPNKIIPFRFV